MPKPIAYYNVAEVISVEKVSDMDYEKWKWREEFIHFQGILSIWESTKKFNGQQYISFNDLMGNYLRTGYGKYNISNSIITMTTRNSIYKFKIIHK